MIQIGDIGNSCYFSEADSTSLAEGNSEKKLGIWTFQGSSLTGPSLVTSLYWNSSVNQIQIHREADYEKCFCALRLKLI